MDIVAEVMILQLSWGGPAPSSKSTNPCVYWA
jgi:hypothetical protein